MKAGIIGAGNTGQVLASILAQNDFEVGITSRPGAAHIGQIADRLSALVFPLEKLLIWSDIIVLAVPMGAVEQLATDKLRGKLVIDCINYAVKRDGSIPEILNGKPTSVFVADHFPGAIVIKAFNAITMANLASAIRPSADERFAIPVSGDDSAMKDLVLRLVSLTGFEAYDAGSLADSWRQQTGKPAFCVLAELPELIILLAEAREPVPGLVRIADVQLYREAAIVLVQENQNRAEQMSSDRKQLSQSR